MKKKILLIDDNNDSLDLLELFLYKDYEIIAVTNGFDGLKRAEKEFPHLIATDITMPVMDGIKLFNRVKKSELIKDTPVVAVTSFAENITEKSLLSMGFRAVIPKPLEREEVVRVIASVIAKTPTVRMKSVKKKG